MDLPLWPLHGQLALDEGALSQCCGVRSAGEAPWGPRGRERACVFLWGGLRVRCRVEFVQVVIVGLHRFTAGFWVGVVSVRVWLGLVVTLVLLGAVGPLRFGASRLVCTVVSCGLYFDLLLVRFWSLVTWLQVPLAGILLLVFGPAVSSEPVAPGLAPGLVPTALLLVGKTVAQEGRNRVRGLAFLWDARLGQRVGLVSRSAAGAMPVRVEVHQDVGVGRHVSAGVAALCVLGCSQHGFAGVRFTP